MSGSRLLRRVAPGEVETPEALFRRILKQRGQKFTTERQTILQAVLDTHAHFAAERLYLALRRHGVKSSRATVYRTLALLCASGVLREVFRGPRGAYYEHVYGHTHHEHLLCVRCGKVTEFDSPKLEALQEAACRTHGFTPLRHHLQVFGYCRACGPATVPQRAKPHRPARP